MTTLLWKEVRENAKWAVLAMLLLGGAEIYALYPHDLQENYGFSLNGSTLLRKAFLAVTTFGCASVGFALGLIQILPELGRDRWAALLHRPVPRGTLFRGKAVAGLFLYLFATVPPFLLAVYLTATPGHFGTPFVPEMVFPGAADICMGAAYYFAGLATGLQRGGWLILRAFPLLAAIHASFFVNTVGEFRVAVEAAVLAGLLLFTAAWGEMLNQDLVKRRPWLGRFAFIAMVFYGVCGAGELINSFFGSMVPQSYGEFQRYELTDQGVPVSIIYGGGGVVVDVLGLDGKPMTDPKYRPEKIRNHIKYLNGVSEFIGDPHGYKPYRHQPGYRDERAYYWGDNPISFPRYQRWFYLIQQRYMIGYYPDKKKAFAILDQQGFKPVTQKPEPFAPDIELGYVGQGSRVLWGPNSARFAYFGDRKIVDVPMPAPTPIYGEGNEFATRGQTSVDVGGFALGTGMAVFDEKAAFVAFLPYKHDVSQWGQLQLGINGTLDRFYLWYQPSGFISTKNRYYQPPGSPDAKLLATMPSYVDETDAQGNVLHSYTLPAVPSDPNRPRTWVTILALRLQTPAFFFGHMLYQKIGALLGSNRLKNDLAWETDSTFHHDDTLGNMIWLPPIYAILGLLALASARRVYFSWPRAWAWALFVAAFGIPGLAIFRLGSDWPCFVPCLECGKPRPIDSPSCPVCGAGWPVPAKTGVEIFDDSRRGAGTASAV